MVFDWLREIVKMRGLKRVRIVETTKRAEPIDVTKFLDFSKTSFPISIPLILQIQSSLEWVVTNIKYRPEDKDFWNFASETLANEFGDCEDGAILLGCFILARNKFIPYYEVLVNVYQTPSGAHVAVTLAGELLDWTNPSLKRVPSDWKLWYCFNRKHAYTTKENAKSWKQ